MTQATLAGGLLDLDKVTLDPLREEWVREAAARCGGSAPWRRRKLAEYQAFLRLDLLSGRLRLLGANLEMDLRLVFSLLAPVPCAPGPDQALRRADFAVVALRYPEEAARLPQPGYAFVQILAPADVFHSNVAPGSQHLCLGAKLPAGIRLTELLLLTYGALTLQSVALDLLDPAGVLNPAAALFYQTHPGAVPLTREPFLVG